MEDRQFYKENISFPARKKNVTSFREKRKKEKKRIRRRKCIYIVAISLIVCICVCVLFQLHGNIKNMKNDGDYLYFYGDREEEVGKIAVFHVDSQEELFYDWYGCSDEKEDRLQRYQESVRQMVEVEPIWTDASAVFLPEAQSVRYCILDDNIQAIEIKRIPPQYLQDGITDLKDVPIEEWLSLPTEDSWREATLRKEAYAICPNADMLQQMGRKASDALTTAVNNDVQIKDDILEYAVCGTEGYLTLFFYQTSQESTADICYWLGDIFYQIALHMIEIDDSFREHCYLMAYAFFSCGLKHLGEGEDEHADDLRICCQQVAEKLETQYGYDIY